MSTEVMMKTVARFEQSFPETPQEPHDDPTSAQNLVIIKRLNKGKFPIYQTISKANQKNYAMKVFTGIVKDSDEYYKNELRFASLDHPNVIKIVGSGRDKTIIQRGLFMNMTYVLSEYAPHGDFLDLIIKHKNDIDDKLTRTYFRQLIEGLEYLHSKGIAHLDIKPENLLIGEGFTLKITDFDLSHCVGDTNIISRGTPRYRAPEFYNSRAANLQLEFPYAADIYSAGIILFILKSGGIYPHSEHQLTDGIDYTKLLEKESSKFWTKHIEMDGKPKNLFDSNFKSLFSDMVKTNPKKRITIKKIKESKWYKGPVYSPQELPEKMKAMLYL